MKIVGYSIDGSTNVHAVEWDHKGAIRDLGAIAVTNWYNSAFGISNSGLITGGGSFPNEPYDDAGSGDGFLVDHHGNLLDLGLLPLGLFSLGSSVNDAEQVVGVADDDDYNAHAFLWNRRDGIMDLNCLVPPLIRFPFRHRKTLTWASKINEYGEIVALEVTRNSYPANIVVLTPNREPNDLAQDVTQRVNIVQGPLVEDPNGIQLYRTPAWQQTVTITNGSSQPILGPISLALDNDLHYDQVNLDGYTNYVAPLCSPYINVPLATDNVLQPGQSASVTLEVVTEYAGVSFSYTPRVLAGGGGC